MEKERKVQVSRIVLRLRGKEISLSPDEARELKDILGEMFGKETVVHEHIYPHWPWYYPYYCTSWTATTEQNTSQTTSGYVTYLTANAAS